MCEPRYSGGTSWRGPAQHALPVVRIDVVRDPHPVGALQHCQVDPGPARRAGLDLQLRVRCAELVEQAVERQRLGVDAGPSAVGLGARLDEVTVVVPLDVADVVFVEQRQDLALDVRVRPGDAEVEHLLVAGLDRPPRPRRHDPLGVRAGDVGVRVDHLGLEPEAELHAQRADPVHERVQPVGPDLGGDHPVAEPRAVVAAGPEPAVVEHEALDADLGGPVGEVEQPVAVVVEVDRLPDVEGDRSPRCDRARSRARRWRWKRRAISSSPSPNAP